MNSSSTGKLEEGSNVARKDSGKAFLFTFLDISKLINPMCQKLYFRFFSFLPVLVVILQDLKKKQYCI